LPSVGRCPSLGLDDDPSTCMTFATESHRCYRLTKSQTIPLDHQNLYCLNENHIRCPIYLRGQRLFPSAVKGQANQVSRSRPKNKRLSSSIAIKWVAGIVLLLALAFGSWWLFSHTDIFTRPDPPVQAFGSLPPGITPTLTRTVALFTPNLTLVHDLTEIPTDPASQELAQNIPVTGFDQETAIVTATATQTRTPTRMACALPEGWVVYNVKLWDTLYWLSMSVRVSVDELKAVNCLKSDLLVVGQPIFLPYDPPKASFTASLTATSPPTDRPPTATSSRTSTATFTRTFTVTFTRTQTPTSTYTASPIPPTNTSVPPTNTLVPPTNTSVPPTAEPTAIPTEEPTENSEG